MNLQLPTHLTQSFTSTSQKVRVVTESWVKAQLYCPACGHGPLEKFDSNHPAADFFCPRCQAQFEFKSKSAALGQRVSDGAYVTMIDKICHKTNSHFLFLSYDNSFKVRHLLGIPQYFFTVKAIHQRKPLAPSAKRAGWVGCDILLHAITLSGRINLVENYTPSPVKQVHHAWRMTQFIAQLPLQSRGWLFDVWHCIEKIRGSEFDLTQIYGYTEFLQKLHPDNRHIQAKIRQQLQRLRDQNILEFLGQGRYRKRLSLLNVN